VPLRGSHFVLPALGAVAEEVEEKTQSRDVVRGTVNVMDLERRVVAATGL